MTPEIALYRYMPPKSSAWGHSLRKMRPARQHALFSEFLDKAVGKHVFSAGSLSATNDSSRQTAQRFARLLGTTAQEFHSYALTPKQCELCVNELIRDDSLTAGEVNRLMILQGIAISQWRIDGREIATHSEINLYYGSFPAISTFLQFQTIEQFRYIKRVLEDLRFCKLNEKHLKRSNILRPRHGPDSEEILTEPKPRTI